MVTTKVNIKLQYITKFENARNAEALHNLDISPPIANFYRSTGTGYSK